MTIRLVPVLLLAAAASLIAAEATPAPATGNPASGVEVAKPSFGWTVNDDPQAGGVVIVEVRPGGTAAALGIEPGDRILSLNGQALKASSEATAFLAGSAIGAPVTVEFKRGSEVRQASGTLLERPRAPNLAQELAAARTELAQLKALAAEKSKEPSLAEVLQSLQDLDKRLPKAVASFRKQYPNGDFDIRISITICSDRTAKDPIEITNLGTGAATPAATATGSSKK
jgi:membrane-associated protease RseP (regulator of RpoE activity)